MKRVLVNFIPEIIATTIILTGFFASGWLLRLTLIDLINHLMQKHPHLFSMTSLPEISLAVFLGICVMALFATMAILIIREICPSKKGGCARQSS